MLQGRFRHHARRLLGPHGETHAHALARQQAGRQGSQTNLDLHRAARGIELGIDKIEPPLCDGRFPRVGVDVCRDAAARLGRRERGPVLLGHAGTHVELARLGQRGERGAGLHQIARLHGDPAHPPGKRRADRRVAHVEACRVERGAGGGHLGAGSLAHQHGVVDFLLADVAGSQQRLQAVNFFLRFVDLGTRAGEAGLALRNLGLRGSRIQVEQHLAGAHGFTFLHMLPQEHTPHLRRHGGLLRGFERAGHFDHHGKIPHHHRHGLHRQRTAAGPTRAPWPGGLILLLDAIDHPGDQGDDNDGDQEADFHAYLSESAGGSRPSAWFKRDRAASQSDSAWDWACRARARSAWAVSHSSRLPTPAL